ncbi:MAG: tRNA 2-thiouridine(34) synthase MnmA [Solirubrobacteraceae bacterium]|nr:tRNA 2-thiouridine(34) synthase MnmA [Solirubrobacteraceae bacterium]
MADERFAEHLAHPTGRGGVPVGAHLGIAGGAACGDLIRIGLLLDGELRISAIGFEADGCGAAQAAASAAVTLAEGEHLFDAARIDAQSVADELGGLSAGKFHAADLASDALAVALGHAARAAEPRALNDGRVLVALSGGVDSAVAAHLEQEAGHEVVCVTLELWRSPENDGERSCCSASAVRLARSVAHRAGMPHLTVDLRDEFRAGVVEPYLEGHRRGVTPNPCVACNGHVRIDAMVGLADRLGAATLVTGHYARLDPKSGRLRAAVDPAKDQSYMLAALAPSTVARLRFPLGERTKPEVRAVAEAAGISVAKRPESQDLCFLAGTGKAAFLARHGGLADAPGPIVDTAGTVVGQHDGAHRFTVGQRRGLDLGGGPPRYVLRIDQAAATVVVGEKDDLLTDRIALTRLALHGTADEVRAVRLRYHAPVIACRLDGAELVLDEPFAGAAPGQSACLLGGDGDVVVGTATIVG